MTIQKLGRYEILGELGKGAMGLVYLGRDPLIGRELALKTFRVGLSAQDKELEQFQARFLREAQSAGILSHPNIVTIHDVAVEPGGDFFIAMEYVKGDDLKQLMQRQGRLDLRFVVDTIAQIADGLDYAHSKGVVHRDIKPANIIITKKERQAKITDFGIARVDASNLTTEGQLLGTPNYMSPEQIQGQPVDHRADLWALGVMLYELVTGKKPFQGENLTQVTHKIVFDQFPDPKKFVPSLPGNLEQILQKALSKKPDDRYQRGGELAAELRAIFARPTSSAIGSSGSFLGGEADPPTGALPIQNPATNLTITSAAAHEALKPSTTAVPTVGSGKYPIPPQPQEPARSGGKAGWIAAAVGGLVVVALLLVMALRSDDAPAGTADGGGRVDPEAELRASYEPFVEEARRLLDAGDADGALAQVERALAVVPENREVRQLRNQAQEMRDQLAGEDPSTAMLEYRLGRVRDAIAERDYSQAIRLAESALELDAENSEAKRLLAEAQEGQSRKDQVRDRFRSGAASASTEPVEGGTAPVAPPPPEAAPPANVTIDFFSEISEGRLTIYSGSDRIFQESFKFETGGGGLLRRSQATSGSLESTVSLPSGVAKFSIYTKPKNQEIRITDIEGTLPAGGTATLSIRLMSDTRVQASIE